MRMRDISYTLCMYFLPTNIHVKIFPESWTNNSFVLAMHWYVITQLDPVLVAWDIWNKIL